MPIFPSRWRFEYAYPGAASTRLGVEDLIRRCVIQCLARRKAVGDQLTSMIHRGVLWCDLRLVEPQDGWILAVGVLIRPGCPGGCRFHCGGLLVLSVGRWFGGYWGQPGWRDQMRVQALTRSSAQAQSSGSFKIW